MAKQKLFHEIPNAVKKGHFGMDADTDEPVRPRPAEARAITEHHAEHMISMLEGLRDLERSLRDSQCGDQARLYHEKDKLTGRFQSARAMYEEDFGPEAAARLEAYVRHQVEIVATQEPDRRR